MNWCVALLLGKALRESQGRSSQQQLTTLWVVPGTLRQEVALPTSVRPENCAGQDEAA